MTTVNEETKPKLPGSHYRVIAYNCTEEGGPPVRFESQGTHELDDFALGEPNFLYLEAMDDREWWLQVGDHCMWIYLDEAGRPTLVHETLGDLAELVAKKEGA